MVFSKISTTPADPTVGVATSVLESAGVTGGMRAAAGNALLDFAGLCVSARNED